MKSILISIRPEYVEKILNGEKTFEIRTTIPKEWKEYLSGKASVKPAPSKQYIYCTNGYMLYDIRNENYLKVERKCTLDYTRKSNKYLSGTPPMLNRKVVAEFTLNEIEKFDIPYPAYFYEVKDKLKHIMDGSCLTLNDLHRYLKNDSGYALHIENLKIYDKPKELSDFTRMIDDSSGFWHYCHREKVTRPPQSWMFVESLEK